MSENNKDISRATLLQVVTLSLSISALAVSVVALNASTRSETPVTAQNQVSTNNSVNKALKERKIAEPVITSEVSDKEQVISSAREQAIERLEAMRKEVSSNPSLVNLDERQGSGNNNRQAATTNEADPSSVTSVSQTNLSPEIDLSQLHDRRSYLEYAGTKVVKLGYTEDGGRKSPREVQNDRSSFAKRIIDQGERFSFVYPAKGDEVARVVVFTDPTCPFCQRLHDDIERIQEAGVSVYYMMFPRALARGYADPTAQQVLSAFEYAWCSDTPTQSLNEVYGNGVSGYAATSCSAEEQGRVTFPYSAHYFMVQLADISATPVTITEDGREILGYRNYTSYLNQIGL